MTTPALMPFAGLVELVTLSTRLPALFLADAKASERFWEFFAANIRNRNTRRAYYKAACRFNEWCEGRGLFDLTTIKPIHVAAYVEELQRTHSKPTVKQHLAALRMLFDWLVVGHIVEVNPAHAVRGPKHVVKKGKTPVLAADEARILLDSIDTSTVMGLRDRALIALMAYTFARVSAATAMKVEDYFVQGRRSWVRLYEKGGKQHEVPAHHNLDEYIETYIKVAGLEGDPKGFLFRTVAGKTGRLTTLPLSQADAYRMVRRRAKAAGIQTKIGNHTFRATGITAYLKNGGKLEIAQQIAAHESSRTTGLYDRRDDDVNLDEVERIGI
ncbi:MAG TPA: tyrosine-type recombinase/integrase [Terriglobales bacterium]|nr:tyrosine-type recombinase/integrase [Terriglobales bacterium]